MAGVRRWWRERRVRRGLNAVDWNPDTDVLIVSCEDNLDGPTAHRVERMIAEILAHQPPPRIIPPLRLTFTVLRDKRAPERVAVQS